MRKLTLSTLSGWVISLCIFVFASAAMAQCPTGTLDGVVYLDGNASGSNDSESGFPNVLITAYDEDNVQAGMAISNNAGTFSINGLTDGLEYRLEYTYPTSVSPTFAQSEENSDVQFVESPTCDLSFGVTDRGLQCGSSDDIILTCFVRSDQTQNLDFPTVLGVEYRFDASSPSTVYATQAETGSVWGSAYRPQTDAIYTSAFVKQNSALATVYDAIYRTVPAGGGYQTSVYTTLSALGQMSGTLAITDPFDCDYGDQVGHEGLGGLAISADGDDLYVVNITDNTLVRLSATSPNPATTTSFEIPDPGCATDENRPFALTEHEGKFYVGVTCTAEATRSSLRSSVTIYEFDPVTSGFTHLFSTNETTGFWLDSPQTSSRISHWLTDIAFTDEDNMVLALSDRKGHRFCEVDSDILNDQKGDILLVEFDGTDWVLESNGQTTNYAGSGIGNGDGIGGGEFFGNDFWVTNPSLHNELSLGSIYVLPSSGSIVSAVFDPLADPYSGGLHRYTTSNGAIEDAIELYTDNSTEYFGKATGFGGITGRCGYTGIEIGNFAWFDDNNNGVQDAGEDAIDNLPLCIYDEHCNKIATTVTDQNGNYAFTDADGILNNSTYYIVIDPDVLGSTGIYRFNNVDYVPSFLQNTVGANSDITIHESNCAEIAGLPAVTVNTGGNGENDYTFDIGLAVNHQFDLALILTSDVRTGAAGMDVKYTVHVENQGNVTANNIKIVNYISDGMVLNDPNWTLSDDGSFAFTYVNIEGGFLPGESLEECITLRIVPDHGYENENFETILFNAAEIAFAENNEGVDFSQNDVDSTPDEISDNDFGGEAFSINDDRFDGLGFVNNDEDDHDSEGLFCVTIAIDDPCTCIGTNTMTGDIEFSELLTIQGPPGQTWVLDFNAGFFDLALVEYPTGTVISDTGTIDPMTGLNVYALTGRRVNGVALQIRAVNEDGVFLQIASDGCLEETLTVVAESGLNAVCGDSAESYTVSDLDPDCTYMWSVEGGAPVPADADGNFIVDWSTFLPGIYEVEVTPTCMSNACVPAGSLVITVGSANGILACPNNLNISLDENCSATITPELMLTSPLTEGAAYGVLITDEHGTQLPSNIITEEYLGETLTVSVFDACSGNSCWGYVTLEDKTPPTIMCDDIEVPCFDVDSYMPFATDNCTDVEIEIVGDFPTALYCDDDYIKSIERTYLATDENGNTASCTQTILVSRFPVDDIEEPAVEVRITCTDANANLNDAGFPSSCLTGVPTLSGEALFSEDGCDSKFKDNLCEVAFSYTDELFSTDPCLTKIFRTWTYFENNCTPFETFEFNQLIIIEDTEVPVFNESLAIHNDVITTNGGACETEYTLPPAIVSDDCQMEILFDVTVFTEAGIPTFFNDLDLATLITTDVILPFGDNIFTYTAKDGCDNLVDDSFVITVVDNTSPTAICEGNTVISLNEDGEAHAFASVFDDGSRDDCSDVEVLVMRDDLCGCDTPVFPNANLLGNFVDPDGSTHYYYNSTRMVRGFLAEDLATAYGGYLAEINSPDEAAFLSSVMMLDAYVGGTDYTVLSGGATSTVDGLTRLPFVMEIENPCGFSEKISFCCEDFDADDTTADVSVTVRVIDAFGNINECWTDVFIQNKVLPLLACPSDISLTCTESTLHTSNTTEEDLNVMFGTFTTDVCGAMIVPTSVIELNQCGIGTVTRTFTAQNFNGTVILDNDGNAVECTQIITVENDDPLSLDDIVFPDDLEDVEVQCIDDISPQMLADMFGDEFGFPVVADGLCFAPTLPEFMDSDPFVTPDGRIKILRTWTIFDLCNDHEEFTHIQRLKLTDLGNCDMLDVALRKTIVTPGPYRRGDVITFQIEVFNQGNIDAFNIGLVDYIPTGLTFASGTANNAAWTLVDPNTAVLTTPIPMLGWADPIDPSTTVLIDLEVSDVAIGDLSNFAEVSLVDNDNDPTNGAQSDVDSTPDMFNNDVLIDDEIDSDALNGDEDDHDVASVFIEVFDLALIKQVNEDATDEPLTPEGTIAFDITIENQGNVDAFNVAINDYFPTELVLSDSDWTDVMGVATLNTPIATIPVGGSSTVTVTFEVEDYDFFVANGTDFSSPLGIINNAEIAAAEDANGPAIDQDSTPADNEGDAADESNDDEFDDGDGTPGQDDDFDPADIEIDIFDLALTKTDAGVGPYVPGNNVTFDICVVNQGTIDATDVEVTDYIPDDLSFVSSPDFVLVGTEYVATIASIEAGATECVSITLMIDSEFMGSMIINDAEITSDTDDDVDSEPGDNDTPDDIANNDDVDDTDGGDDQDPEVITIGQIYDLALTKVETSTGPYTPGSLVSYDICVVNQGTLDASSIEVTDYIPDGMTFSSSDDFAVSGSNAVTTIGSIQAGVTVCVSITLQIDSDFMGMSIINDAEITADDGDDTDSTPGDNGTPDDVANDDDTMDTTGGDDQDPAVIDVDQVYDLALTKMETSTGPYTPGSFVTYDICVVNQGTLDAANIEVTDYIPADMTFSSSTDFTVSGPDAIATIPSILVGTTECVSITLMINSDFMGNMIINDAEITADDGTDVDSTPADNGTPDDVANDDDTMDTDGGDDQDPEVITVDQIYDLAIEKELLTMGPFDLGSEVTFSVTVTNEGTLDAANVQITDTPEMGLNFVSSNFGTNVTMVSNTVYTIASLPVGSTETIELTYTIDESFSGNTLVNRVMITADDGDDIDSDPATGDDIDEDGDGQGDDDDEDEAEVPVVQIFDLALVKTINTTLTDSPLAPGGTITFDIDVINQGTIDATNVGVVDYFPSELILNDANWSSVPMSNVATLNTAIALVPMGTTTTVSITFMVEDLAFFTANGVTFDMGQTFINDAEISSDQDDDIDSTPGDNATPGDIANDDDTADTNGGDDQDPAEFEVNVYDLAIAKAITSEAPYIQGENVTYEIVITNEGSLTANNVQFTDTPDISGGLIFVSDDSGTNANITPTTPGSVWTVSTLAPGQSETLTVTFMIDTDFVGSTLTNDVEITLDDGNDIDSDPMTSDDTDEDMDGDPDDDDEDEVTIMVGCTIPECPESPALITVSLDEMGSGTLYAIVDANGEIALVQEEPELTGFEGCEATYTVSPLIIDLSCNDMGIDTICVTINSIVDDVQTECCFDVEVIDELPPTILECTETFELTCDQLILAPDGTFDLEPFSPEFEDNCDQFTLDSEVDMSQFDPVCNTGVITVVWTATDAEGNVSTETCVQTITVGAIELTLAGIDFPDDFMLADCGDSTDPADTGMPVITGGVCGAVTVVFEDDIPAEDSCQETITRTWTVTDVCGGGVFTDTQLITFIDDEGPVISGLPDLASLFEVGPPDCVQVLSIEGSISDVCSSIDSMYHVINGDTIFNSLDASGAYDIGSFTIDFVGVDVCGNTTVESLSFTVAEPIVPPGIACLKLEFEVGPDGPTIVTADELASGGFNCSDEGFTYEFVAGTPNVDIGPTDPITILGDQEVSCNDLNSFFIFIGLFEFNPATGLSEYTGDFCVAEIDPVDVNPMDCDGANGLVSDVSGKIITELGEVVSDADVHLIGDMTGTSKSSDYGDYQFEELEMGGVYRITPSKDNDHRNGVSTLDIIMVQRYLLGLEDFDSPYKYIAADVSKNGQISAQDLSEMRKLVLEVVDRFPSNESYRMVDANHAFIEGVNPLQTNFPERYDIYDLQTDMNIDFIGVKVGDINNSAKPNDLPGLASVVRSQSALMTYQDRALESGSATSITLTIESKEAFIGFQTKMTLGEKIEDVKLESDLPGFGESHYNISDGQLTISYHNPTLDGITEGSLTLVVTTDKGSSVSDLFDTDYAYANELYTVDGVSDLGLSSRGVEEGQFTVYQNTPNPFTDHTQIAFNLEVAAAVSMKVFNPDGKVIFTRSINGQKGLNTIKINNEDLPAEGIYYYELDNGTSRVLKRMLKIK